MRWVWLAVRVSLRVIWRGNRIAVVTAGVMAVAPSGWAADVERMAFFESYCLECHDGQTAKGEVNLEPLLDGAVGKKPWDWLEVREQIENGEMPPEEPLPNADERAAMLKWIDAGLESVDWQRYRRAGHTPAARLTRDQYRNTLRDLLGVDLHAGSRLPPEGEGASGFFNDRRALGLTANQLEGYFEAAERVTKGVLELEKEPQRQRFLATEMAWRAGHKVMFREGAMLVHPGNQIQADVKFPVDGHYRFEVFVRVFGKPSVLQVMVDGEVVAEAQVASNQRQRVVASGFVTAGVGGRRMVTLQAKNLVPQTPLPGDVAQQVAQRAGENAARLKKAAGGESDGLRQAREALNERSEAIQEAYEWLRFLGPQGDSREIDRFRKYALERDVGSEGARNRLAAALGKSRAEFDAFWEEQNSAVLVDNRRLLEAIAHVRWGDWQNYQGKIVADWLHVVGPVEDGGRPLVQLVDTDGKVSRSFVERAFRRPLVNGELERYDAVRLAALERGESETEALQWALVGVLVSPDFLLLNDMVRTADPGEDGATAFDDFSLASRLSYFLWQSMPDDELFSLAKQGRLAEPEVLRAQVGRMLNDRRAEAFYASFSEEWLGLAALGRGVGADQNRFPEFTPELATAMRSEAVLAFREVVRKDLSVLRLIDSDSTWLNEPLAKLYGIDGVKGSKLRKVSLKDARRGGLLGMAAVLTATSAPTRAHPSRRGTWVLETLLGQQQGEPLADAGELPGKAGEQRGRTLREELDLHRTRKDCASCHSVIDPVGLGLQAFDGIGRWRDLEAGAPIDDRGQLPDGSKFDGPVELKRALIARRGEFYRHLSAEMMAFALGRKIERFDRAEVDRIVAAVEERDGSAQALIEAVVTSFPFRYSDVESASD